MITDGDKYAVLSYILGDEDHLGDMDFKVTGTVNGVTATQMDIKIDGLPYEILEQALQQAKQGRLHILSKMLEVMPEPRPDLKPHAPRIIQMTIPKDSIGALIGPGGKVIQEIQRVTETIITIEETEGKGIVEVAAFNNESMDKAIAMIKDVAEYQKLEIFTKAKLSQFNPMELCGNYAKHDGLLHISEIEGAD